MERAIINETKTILPYLVRRKNVWSNYDQEADILYMHFKKPNHADNSEMTDDDIIIRYEKEEVVGLSILNASKRIPI